MFPDGTEYRGYAIKSIFNGEGIFTWNSSGDYGIRPTYKGKWQYGKMNGEGEFKNEKGEVHRGTFVNNLFVVMNGGKQYYLSPLETSSEHKKSI